MQKRIAVLASASVFTIAVGIGFLNGRSETTSRSISKKPYTVADAPSFTAPRPESRSPASATRLPRLGVYKWDVRGIGDLPAYEKWLGSEVEVAEAFTNRWQWSDIGADWSLGPWSQWLAEKPGRRTLLYTIPMVVGNWDGSGQDGVMGNEDDVSLAGCSEGKYNHIWTKLANDFARWGMQDVIIRPGHEMNGNWYPWHISGFRELEYGGCFRQIVTSMRNAQPANRWKYEWNVSQERYDNGTLRAYPGDEYVDFIGMTLYDWDYQHNDTYPYPWPCDDACRLQRQKNAWGHFNWILDRYREFAVEHGKQMAISEWGVGHGQNGRSGGDNPYFIHRMAAWLKDPVNVVNYHIYFDVNNENNHELQDWVVWPMHSPNSSAAYIEEFGNQAVPTQVYIGSSNLMAKHSWKCVDVTGWSSADDLELSQYTCVNQQWNQQFYIDHVGSNQYTLKSHHTQKCMDVRGASLASGASIVQNSCNSSESQKFQIKAVSFGLYNIINVKSGKCVAVSGADSSNSGKIVQETCVPGAMHQQFEMNGMGVR